MKKFGLLYAFVILVVYGFLFFLTPVGNTPAAFGSTSNEDIAKKIHGKTHHIEERVLLIGGASCSATAIGAYAILTATHCELPTTELMLDGQPAHIYAYARDGRDHTIMLLSGIKPFTEWADVNEREPQIGEQLFEFGNPGMWEDYFRVGYVMKVEFNNEDDHSKGYDFLFEMNSFPGDSGSGLFDSNGVLIGVLSFGDAQSHGIFKIQASGAFNLAFPKDVLEQARQFHPPQS